MIKKRVITSFFFETISRCISKYSKRFYLEIIIEGINISKFMPQNPFYLGWNKGWTFLFYLEGGTPKIEASGFGIAMTTDIKKGESFSKKDKLILKSNEIENLDTIFGLVKLN